MVNGLNPTAAAAPLIQVDQGTEMLPTPGNGFGAGCAGATPVPTAASSRSHVCADNMQQPGAHTTANNEYIKQV